MVAVIVIIISAGEMAEGGGGGSGCSGGQKPAGDNQISHNQMDVNECLASWLTYLQVMIGIRVSIYVAENTYIYIERERWHARPSLFRLCFVRHVRFVIHGILLLYYTAL